jgi:hypothetical protein
MRDRRKIFDSILAKVDRDIDGQNRSIEYLQNELKKGKAWDITYFRYYCEMGQFKMLKNQIDEARQWFKQGISYYIRDIKSMKELPEGLIKDINIPYFGYFGGGLTAAVQCAELALTAREKWNVKGSDINCHRRDLLLLAFLIDDKNRIDRYSNAIKETSKGTEIQPDGMPVSNGIKAFCNIFAIATTTIIESINNKSNSDFERGLDIWSKIKIPNIYKHSHPWDIFDMELTVLYDIALGVGLNPKISTPFIPKAIIDNGYWNLKKPTLEP